MGTFPLHGLRIYWFAIFRRFVKLCFVTLLFSRTTGMFFWCLLFAQPFPQTGRVHEAQQWSLTSNTAFLFRRDLLIPADRQAKNQTHAFKGWQRFFVPRHILGHITYFDVGLSVYFRKTYYRCLFQQICLVRTSIARQSLFADHGISIGKSFLQNYMIQTLLHFWNEAPDNVIFFEDFWSTQHKLQASWYFCPTLFVVQQ